MESRIDEATRADLIKRGHKIKVWPSYEFDASGTAMVVDLRQPTCGSRVLAGGADPRRLLYALGR